MTVEQRFFGLNADEWEAADGLPVSPWTHTQLTVDEVKAGIAAMLRRLTEEDTTP